MISYVLGPTAAAFCFVATQITAIFPMIAGAITGYAMSLISRLFYAGAKEDLRGVLHSLAVISALLTGSALLAIAVTGKLLLATFGPIYVEVFPALIVLAAGTAATALSGPAAYLLLLTGNERTYPRIFGLAMLGRRCCGPGLLVRTDGCRGRFERLEHCDVACPGAGLSPTCRPRSIFAQAGFAAAFLDGPGGPLLYEATFSCG